MVATSFPDRLKEAMDDLDLPQRGRPAWLARRLKLSVTATQKYLEGIALPKGSRWEALARVLSVNVAWLRDGTGPKERRVDPLLGAFLAVWGKLTNTGREDVLWYARQILERLGEEPPANPAPQQKKTALL
jgi:hypothetical protein